MLSVKLELYPNVSILDSGIALGTKSLSHIADALSDLHDLKACPARPVTAATLSVLSVIRISTSFQFFDLLYGRLFSAVKGCNPKEITIDGQVSLSTSEVQLMNGVTRRTSGQCQWLLAVEGYSSGLVDVVCGERNNQCIFRRGPYNLPTE